MLCSSLEDMDSRALHPPEMELWERMKSRTGEVTERHVIGFLEHMVTRVEASVSTLEMRHIAMDRGPITELDDLRAPMASILDSVAAQLEELKLYKARFGELKDHECKEENQIDGYVDGSDTEQE